MKLWDKGISTDAFIEKFTVGRDPEFDMLLAPFDVIGSIAHVKMLASVGLLTEEEGRILTDELRNIYTEINEGKITIEKGVEDIHSQIELELTRRLGEVGKKIHSGRSRNDQVLVDIKLYLRSVLHSIVDEVFSLANTLLDLSESYKDHLLPGYTHLQIAMPSSFGLWFGAYAESLSDDLIILQSAFAIVNKNPLGSGAGYGSSFPLNRTLTTELLGFDSLHHNSVYAQMSRGKTEKIVANGIGSIAGTLSKMAMDITLYVSQNFGFISFPVTLTTGSSIMPHKKNPDVFELIRAKCNKIQSISFDIHSLVNNLPSGYHRDMQILKEILFPALYDLLDCLHLMSHAISHVNVNKGIMENDLYKYAFSVDEVNRRVQEGMSFRDAYKAVAQAIEDDTYNPSYKPQHTHEGSLGNLCTEIIRENLQKNKKAFRFEKIQQAESLLLSGF